MAGASGIGNVASTVGAPAAASSLVLATGGSAAAAATAAAATGATVGASVASSAFAAYKIWSHGLEAISNWFAARGNLRDVAQEIVNRQQTVAQASPA